MSFRSIFDFEKSDVFVGGKPCSIVFKMVILYTRKYIELIYIKFCHLNAKKANKGILMIKVALKNGLYTTIGSSSYSAFRFDSEISTL